MLSIALSSVRDLAFYPLFDLPVGTGSKHEKSNRLSGLSSLVPPRPRKGKKGAEHQAGLDEFPGRVFYRQIRQVYTQISLAALAAKTATQKREKVPSGDYSLLCQYERWELIGFRLA